MMFSFLPPLPCHTRGTHLSDDPGESRHIILKLPPWDSPTTINWEPLEPPSPYRPVIRQNAYPSVAKRLQRFKPSDGNAAEKIVTPRCLSTGETTPREMTYEEELACKGRLLKEESEARDVLVFSEQREWTQLWVDFLQRNCVLLEVDIQSAEEEARTASERDEERRRMCYTIEMESTLSRIQKRLQDAMQKKTAEIMPMYKDGRNCIMEKEKGELSDLLEWFRKNCPFGMQLPAFLGGQRRRLCPKKPTGRYGAARSTRGRGPPTSTRNKAVPTNATTTEVDKWPDVFPEPSYMAEGKQAWQEIKNLRYAERKTCSSTQETENMEVAAREEILAAEAVAWLPIMALGVDDYYEAKRRMQQREKTELAAVEEKLEELEKREAIMERLENEALAKGFEYKVIAKNEAAGMGDIGICEAATVETEHDVNVKEEGAVMQELKACKDVAESSMNSEDSEIKNETARISDLKKREDVAEQLEIEDTLMNLESAQIGDLKKRESVEQLEIEDTEIKNEAVLIEDLKRRETVAEQLEIDDAEIKNEAARLADLKKREALAEQLETALMQREDEASARIAAAVLAGSSAVSAVANNNQRSEAAATHSATEADEASSSWGSDSNGVPHHPMLNVVLGIAVERDPFVGLRNPALAALGEAECVHAACEGDSAGRAACALARARHVPFCPAYLVHGLWRPRSICEDANSSGSCETRDGGVAALKGSEVVERGRLLAEQIAAVWALYQQAAAEAAAASNTKCGELCYKGVHMSNNF
ncbi:hypothetical protein DQ04_01381030 [Trypanosoma grayi]|uniref:hypothetical protein n=1 Tax=Trypanosoma grayi TaxID=71804 RepID=UPI0004F4139C|nr:hypothetical protein DQ04_01381030 [Trypanosoma grayi]KEG12847.1 hypothetical protein DQ04_01381030 [Trypanosoma grayi]